MCRKRAEGSTNLITYTSDELLSNPGLVAYEDGYADARDSGKDNFAPDPSYTAEQRLRYIAGFTKGMRIYNARFNIPGQSTVAV